MCDRVNQEQVKSKAILSPWSVPIGGEDVCILSSLAFHKVLLAAIQFTVAGSKLTIDYLFSHPGFILFFLCLMWTRSSFWTENLFKNWPRINLSCSSIFFFLPKTLDRRKINQNLSVGCQNELSQFYFLFTLSGKLWVKTTCLWLNLICDHF